MPSISSLLLAALAVSPLFSAAVPLRKARAAAAIDLTVLNFASVLEALENGFYTQALGKFQAADYLAAGYTNSQLPMEQFQSIMTDEAAHLKTLNTSIVALGGQVITGCTFSFDSVLTDVVTMAATARVVESVGVGAYLGAAHLITDSRVLEAAASIMTIEARHQTVLNIMSGTGKAIPSGFDIALSPPEVLAIAGGFISGCDTGITPNTALTLTNTGTPSVGTSLTFSWSGMPSDTSSLSCQMIVGGAVNSISLPLSSCTVPSGVNGAVAIWITNSTQPLLNNVIDRSTAQTVAGPTMTFIDTQPEALGGVVRPGTNTSSATTSTSPAQASAVAGASPSSSSTTGPNLSTGPGADGVVSVNGWMNLPPGA